MSSYTDEPKYKISTDGRTATITHGFEFHLGHKNSGDYVAVLAGQDTDGLTMPAWAEPLFRRFAPRWSCIKAVMVHDQLCKDRFYIDQTHYGTAVDYYIDQKTIDGIFLEALLVSKINPIRAHIYYYLVRVYQDYKAFKRWTMDF